MLARAGVWDDHSKPQVQEVEQGGTQRRDQLHLEGADGSQKVSNDSNNLEKRRNTWEMGDWGLYGWPILEGKLGAVVLSDLQRGGGRFQQQMRDCRGVVRPLGAAQARPGSRASPHRHCFSTVATCWQWAPEVEKTSPRAEN